MTIPQVTPTLVSRRLFAAAAVCAVLVVALYLSFVTTNTGQRVDDAALRGRIVGNPDARAQSQRVLRTISVGSLALLGGALVTVAVVRGQKRLAVAVGVVILGANVTTQVLKEGLARPDLHSTPWPTPNTLPSGHATVAMSLAVALVLVVPPRGRAVAATVGALYASAIAVMTLAAGWHRPSDAFSAFAVVGVWAFGAAATLMAMRSVGIAHHRIGTPGLVAGAVLVLGTAFVALSVTTTIGAADSFETVRIGAAYLLSSGAIAVAAVALLVALVLLLRGVSLDGP